MDWQRIPKIDAHAHVFPDERVKAPAAEDACFAKAGTDDCLRFMDEN